MDIMIVGVGGQGTLLASRLLGNYAAIIKKDCKLSEVHGMAQRGGSVVTHVRISDKVYSPIIELGGADILLSFEMLEAARYVDYVKKEGVIVTNDQQILPMPVICGSAEYPKTLQQDISAKRKLKVVPAYAASKEVGSDKTVNVIMIGALAAAMDMDYAAVEKALEMTVPPKFLEMNKKALKKGFELGGNL